MAITVRREALAVEFCGDERDGMLLQRRLPSLCADVVAPALESALAPFDSEGSHLMIDVLDLDLGELPLERVESELGPAVQREIERVMRVREPSTTDAVGPRAARGEPAGAHRRTTAASVGEAFVAFLRTGRLPWWFTLPEGATLEEVARGAWMTEHGMLPSPAAIASIADALLLDDVRVRLVRQCTPTFAVDLLRAISPAVASATGQIMAILEPVALLESSRRAFAQRVWDAALLAAAAQEQPSTEALVATAWRTAESMTRGDAALLELLQRHWPSVTASAPRAAAALREPAGATRERSSADTEPPDEAEQGILVQLAGLVLLPPFLPQLFRELDLVVGDELLDPERALSMLHLLATGELVAPEHRLVVAKLLCGVPLERAAAADVGITPAEVAEADAMLRAVVSQWGALGDASPAALREAFLARDGLLTLDADGDWLLRVEARTIDVLLDSLPWGLSLVHLPWMPRMLHVEWR